MNTELATITAIVGNDTVKKSDAVIWLEGDALARRDEVVRVFEEGLADHIVVSGGFEGNQEIAIPAPALAEELYKRGIPKEKVVVEGMSQNTFEQGVEVMKIVKERDWKKIILVASHYHQLRAFLTFLKAMREAGLEICIYNSPARELPWVEKLFEDEMKKIEEYGAKGHVASIQDALKYQEWKEQQP